MTLFQALFIAVLQGVTELFPISSLGHSVVLPALLGWQINLHDFAFLPFLTLLHLGTGIALLLYFRRDWIRLVRNGLSRSPRDEADRRLFWLVVLATLPAVAIGAGFESVFRNMFGSPTTAAIFLIVNGVLLLGGERLRARDRGHVPIDQLGWKRALLIGFSQALALFPGISRSGVTMIAGMGLGLKASDAARVSFLLATPIIFAATAYEFHKMHQAHAAFTGIELAAAVVAGVTAYASVTFLMRYFGRHEFKALNPFGYYCLGFGTAALAILTLA